MFLLFIFSVSSLFAQTSTNTLPALAPAYPELPPTFWEQHGPATHSGQAIFILIVALAGILFFVIWQQQHPPPPPILPPEVQAGEALAKLLRQPEDGTTLSEVSRILRCYFTSVLGLPPAKLTTAEICTALAGQKTFGPELVQSISDFLRKCDERKFSPAPDAAPLNAASCALELIALAEKARGRRSAPVPGAATAQTPGASANTKAPSTSDAAASEDGRTP